MSSLALPRPNNLRGVPWGTLIEADVYHICERLEKIDPNLYVYQNPDFYAVVEMCRDGVERLVFKTKELDGRVVERIEYLLRVPFEVRFAEAEKLEAKREEERKADELDTLYEEMGRPMLTDLERCGFIQRSTSYAKRGIKK